MRVIYLKKTGSYLLVPVSQEEEENISEIAMVFCSGDRIYYYKGRSKKAGYHLFKALSRCGSCKVKIEFSLSGCTNEDNENIENIVSHAFLPGNTFYLVFMRGIRIAGKWVIVICPRIRKKLKVENARLNAR